MRKSNTALNRTNKSLSEGDLNSDEHYTQYIDIATELFYYKEFLKNANILCPCDDENSQFTKFFKNAMNLYEINSFEHYSYNPQTNEGIQFQKSIPQFASKYPDGIVVTNPPFSCIREYVELLDRHKLKYLFIAPMTSAPYRTHFLLHILNRKMWCGHNQPKKFNLPDGSEKGFGNICWFTNLRYKECFTTIYLTHYMKHHEYKYSKTQTDILWVEECAEIPIDYTGLMRVPMSYIIKHNPDQFEIIYGGNNTMADKNNQVIKVDTPDGKTPFLSFIIKRVNGAKI
ncbi:MAG: adenine-specific methyltransferase EcoRI family protein [Christensenellaceae bacterium]|nr:adenine-specific methyltransferase EcoRI family protein [Christensenellaceae bacterium]